MSETIERPNNSASFAEKAKWAILAALKKAGAKGLFFSKLKSEVKKEFPDEPIYGDSEKTTSNIAAAVNALKRAGDVTKIAFSEMSEEDRAKKKTRWALPRDQKDDEIPAETTEQESSPDQLRESHLYSPTVTAALGQDICTTATVIGASLTKWEYGTPDVVGVLRPPLHVRPLNLPSEVVAIEVKHGTKLHSLVTGLAQAIRYKRFAHRAYLVVQPQGKGEIPSWLEDQCRYSGIGLCELDANEATFPRVITRAPSDVPELHLLSDFIRKLPADKRGDLCLD